MYVTADIQVQLFKFQKFISQNISGNCLHDVLKNLSTVTDDSTLPLLSFLIDAAINQSGFINFTTIFGSPRHFNIVNVSIHIMQTSTRWQLNTKNFSRVSFVVY